MDMLISLSLCFMYDFGWTKRGSLCSSLILIYGWYPNTLPECLLALLSIISTFYLLNLLNYPVGPSFRTGEHSVLNRICLPPISFSSPFENGYHCFLAFLTDCSYFFLSYFYMLAILAYINFNPNFFGEYPILLLTKLKPD